LSYAGTKSVVQILPPFLLGDSRLAHKATSSMNRHAAWLAEQFHTCFRRRPAPFARIAVTARGN